MLLNSPFSQRLVAYDSIRSTYNIYIDKQQQKSPYIQAIDLNGGGADYGVTFDFLPDGRLIYPCRMNNIGVGVGLTFDKLGVFQGYFAASTDIGIIEKIRVGSDNNVYVVSTNKSSAGFLTVFDPNGTMVVAPIDLMLKSPATFIDIALKDAALHVNTTKTYYSDVFLLSVFSSGWSVSTAILPS